MTSKLTYEMEGCHESTDAKTAWPTAASALALTSKQQWATKMDGVAHIADLQMSTRSTPLRKAVEDATALVECALIVHGRSMLASSYARRIVEIIQREILCEVTGDPLDQWSPTFLTPWSGYGRWGITCTHMYA